ncbi:MAG: GFA family protein [Gammaproteobacteria bacterium]|nr:GFA family protein [Gammaproteobacteria bacterium]
MQLKGSCHCGKVRFQLGSAHPYPFNLCYCSVCRKTAGGGGYAINLGGEAASMKVRGEQHLSIYQARIPDAAGRRKKSPARRHFCQHCGSPLWVWDPRWPELIHPFASAIDTPLPVPPERVHLMLGSVADWVKPTISKRDQTYCEYPRESLAEWHRRLKLEC